MNGEVVALMRQTRVRLPEMVRRHGSNQWHFPKEQSHNASLISSKICDRRNITVEEHELNLRIILETPPSGVDFALQKGRGNDYETVQTQRSGTSNLRFEFTVRVKTSKDGSPNFLGPFVHGPVGERFVYIDVGKMAGQRDSPWSRRIKIPLKGISWDAIKSGNRLEARITGTGKDGTPTCATVKPFTGWH